MKKLLLGLFFGVTLTGMFMSSFNIRLERELEAARIENNRLGNEVAQLKLTLNDFRVENAQLYWELEQAK